MPTSKLVTCEWLADHLNDPDIRIIEVSSDEEGKAYRAGHIPGATFWFWKDALWHDTDREFSTPQEMADHLGQIGATPETKVVLYGDPVQYGTYALWVLTMAGHKNTVLLDGSRTRWIAEDRPTSTEIPQFEPINYAVQPGDISSRVGRDDVRDHIGDGSRTMLDVRSPEEYRGERVSPPGGFDHGAERKGRIPGAVHMFYQELLNEDDTFISPEQMRKKLASAGVSSEPPDEVVTYCRLSHRATLAWFALTELAGVENVRIYDGSWTEWGSIVGFPIER